MKEIKKSGPFTLLVGEADVNDGAHHKFQVMAGEVVVTEVSFQQGPLKEVAPNGAPDVLIAEMLRDRIAHYAQKFGGARNTAMLKAIDDFIAECDARTADREASGVEGTRK